MKIVIIVLTLLFLGCNNSVQKPDRDPKGIFNVNVTYGHPEPPTITDTSYSFNNLEELDAYHVSRGKGEETSPRFKAIKFLTDYKRSGYKICPDDNEDNLFNERFVNPKAKDYLPNSSVNKNEASFFYLTVPVSVSYLYFFDKVKFQNFNIIFPWKNDSKLNNRLNKELENMGLECSSCNEENISLAYIESAKNKNLPLFILTHQTDEYLEFSSELGRIKIIPDFQRCEKYKFVEL